MNSSSAALATAAAAGRHASVNVYSHDIEAAAVHACSRRDPRRCRKRRDACSSERWISATAICTFVYAVPRDLAREGFLRGLWVALLGLAITRGAVLLVGYISNRATALCRGSGLAPLGGRPAEGADPRTEPSRPQRHVGGAGGGALELHAGTQSAPRFRRPAKAACRRWRKRVSLLTASDWRSLSLRSLMSEDIIPFAGRITVDGPDIALRARSAQTFALLFYELATNAAKHGALSVPGGKVGLRWYIDNLGSDPIFHLHWKESGGPPVDAPTRRGFGELLVRRIAPRDVAGKSEVRYDPAGFEYELEAPLRELIDAPQERASARERPAIASQAAMTLDRGAKARNQ